MASQRELMRRFGVVPKKSLGQNFLTDPGSQDKIVRGMALTDADRLVVEIGPGLGAVTSKITDPGRKIVAIEYDDHLAELLPELFDDSQQVEIVHEDALRFDYNNLFEQHGKPYKLVGNLPYSISSPLMFKIIEQRKCFDSACFLLQKEVAEMLAAKVGAKPYSLLSVLLGRVAEVHKLFDVKRGAFTPVPRVDSSMISIRFEEFHPVPDENRFTLLVKAAFHQRRKKIANSLAKQPFIRYSEKEWSKLRQFHADKLERRAEQLSVADFVEMARTLDE